MTVPPLVTVAVPLFRSAPFVENIAANIDRLTWPNLEILVSDRHGLDDALDRLQERYAADPRVRIIRRIDGSDWVSHYNDLMRDARGTYFCWMPHDDSYAPGYIETLSDALGVNPDALLAFGVLHWEGSAPTFTPPPVSLNGRCTPMDAVHLHLDWRLAWVIRGLMRKDAIVDRGLWLPRTHVLVFADVCWAFAVALSGRLVFVPRATCAKRRHATSTSADWRFGVKEAISECQTMAKALWRSPHRPTEVVPAIAALASVATARIVWRTMRGAVGYSGRRAPAGVRSAALLPLRVARRKQSRIHDADV